MLSTAKEMSVLELVPIVKDPGEASSPTIFRITNSRGRQPILRKFIFGVFCGG